MKFVTITLFGIFLYSITLNAQDNSFSILTVQDKTFLSLCPEVAPENMVYGDFGSEIESFYGVTAYSNGSRKKGRKFQCTELVHRFIASVYGIPTRIHMGLGHGKDLAKNIAIHFKNTRGSSDTLAGYVVQLENFENKKTIYPPVVGSIVSMYFNSSNTGYGHVGIIREIEAHEDGVLVATLFDQHGFIHKQDGLPIQADHIYFERDEAGLWNGQVHSWLYDQKYEVVSWTNPVLVNNQ
jgi:hypothetical protein